MCSAIWRQAHQIWPSRLPLDCIISAEQNAVSAINPPTLILNRVYLAKLLVFVPAGFFGCDELLPALQVIEERHGDTLQILIVSFEPAVEAQFEVARRVGIRAPVLTQHGWRVAEACNILTAPYALIVDQEHIARAKLPVGEIQGLEEVIRISQSNINGAKAGGES